MPVWITPRFGVIADKLSFGTGMNGAGIRVILLLFIR